MYLREKAHLIVLQEDKFGIEDMEKKHCDLKVDEKE